MSPETETKKIETARDLLESPFICIGCLGEKTEETGAPCKRCGGSGAEPAPLG
jgi:hypothetical protein